MENYSNCLMEEVRYFVVNEILPLTWNHSRKRFDFETEICGEAFVFSVNYDPTINYDMPRKIYVNKKGYKMGMPTSHLACFIEMWVQRMYEEYVFQVESYHKRRRVA